MTGPARAALLALCLAGPWPTLARAEDPRALFDAAQRADLGGAGQAALAFSLFRRAAEAGLTEAEFNVAVMLDSGRGTGQDRAEAATWYARAALHGSRRAAYDLAQLYEAGQGVPRNGALAEAWFAASGLPAGRGRRVAPDARDGEDAGLAGPVPVSPAAGERVLKGEGGLALVWTSSPQPEPVRFLVELRALDPSGSREVYAGETDLSGALATLDGPEGPYAWRVSAVAEGTGRYRPSGWVRFRLGAPAP